MKSDQKTDDVVSPDVQFYEQMMDAMTTLNVPPSTALAVIAAALVTILVRVDKHHMIEAMALRDYMRQVADRITTLSVSDPGDMDTIARTLGFGTTIDTSRVM